MKGNGIFGRFVPGLVLAFVHLSVSNKTPPNQAQGFKGKAGHDNLAADTFSFLAPEEPQELLLS